MGSQTRVGNTRMTVAGDVALRARAGNGASETGMLGGGSASPHFLIDTSHCAVDPRAAFARTGQADAARTFLPM